MLKQNISYSIECDDCGMSLCPVNFKTRGEPVLTSIDPLGEVQFMLFPSEGEDFRDAVHNAMLKVRMHPRWRWLLVHIPPERWTLGHVPRGGGE